jgi:hypothetical protein
MIPEAEAARSADGDGGAVDGPGGDGDRSDAALWCGAELTTVRDNLRHASLSTTSMYLHSDDLRRARQIGGAFEAPAS